MGKSQGGKKCRKATKADSAEEWVMCTGCSYWHTLEATPYESVEEAEAAPDFYCQQCETTRILREEFVLKLKQEAELCKLAVANVRAVLEEEISMRKREQERIEVLLKEEKHRRELLEQKLAGVACSSGHLDARAAEILTELPQVETTMETTTTQGDTVRGRRDPSAGGMLTSTEESERKPGDRGNAVLMNESQEAIGESGDTKVTAASKTECKNTAIEKRGKAGITGKAGEREGRQKIGPGIENERRVFVFGDGDAFRMKRAALRMVGWNQNVQFRTQTKATMGEVAAAVDATPEVWEAAEAMVVIHAGSGDVMNNDLSQEETIQSLRIQLRKWKERAPKHRFVVYAVPMLPAGDTEVFNSCRLWNDGIKTMCQELGPWVEFAAHNWLREKEHEGRGYPDHLAYELGKRLGRRMCAFLAVRPSAGHWKAGWRNSYQADSLMETLSQTLAHIVDGRWRRRDGKGPRRM